VELIYTVALGISLNAALGIFVQSFGMCRLEAGSADSRSLDVGFAYRLGGNFQLDASAGLGLNPAASDWFVGAGMALRLPR
jgi:hypothetical protein